MLSRLEEEDESHYVYIKDIHKLLQLSSRDRDRTRGYCPYCNNLFAHEKLNEHISSCYKLNFDERIASLPEPGSIMKFKNYRNKLERPFAIYSDCEAALKKLNKALRKNNIKR